MGDSLVYVLTNEAMPGLVKIGITAADDPIDRANQLYSTGVPLPFDVEFAARVGDASAVERALHNAFRHNRVNPRREFFRIDPDQAIGILKLFDAQDATSDVARSLNESLSPEELRAVEQERGRRPPLNFDEMGIPIGAELVFEQDPTVSVTIVEAKKVQHLGEVVSLSPVTSQILGLEYYVAPTKYWSYEGTNLKDIYDDTYNFVE